MIYNTQGSRIVVGAIAGAVGFVAFVGLLGVGGYAFSPALFSGLVTALVVAIALLLVLRARGAEPGSQAERTLSTSREDQGDRPASAGKAGAVPVVARPAADATTEAPPERLTVDEGSDTEVRQGPAEDRAETPLAGHGPMPEAEAETMRGPQAADADMGGAEAEDAGPRDANPRISETDRRDGPHATGETQDGESAGAGSDGSSAIAPESSETGRLDDDTAQMETAGATGAVGEEALPDLAEDDAPLPAEPDRSASGSAVGGTQEAPKWSSSQLQGEQELASRKASWRYEPEPREPSGAQVAPDDAAPAVEEPVSDEPVSEGIVDIGTEPRRLSEPREEGADDLKKLKGVGPKLETMLNRMGVYHFDQISGWTEQEVAWVDENLKGFKGRASRDNWVSQARALAEGGETDFSRKIGGGGV